MTLQSVKSKWEWVMVMALASGLVIWIVGCPPTTTSLLNGTTKITRDELQLELDSLIMSAKFRMEDLDRQEKLRQMVLQNALLVLQGQPFNPLGILSGVAALYGIGAAVGTGKKKLKELAVKETYELNPGKEKPQ